MALINFRMLLVVTVLISLSSTCLAGGSIGWDEVSVRIAKTDPFISNFIAKHFEVARVGWGVRVGQDKEGNTLLPGYGVGERMPPFEFYARAKDETGDFTLILKLEEIYPGDGKTTKWQVSIRKKLASD